MSRPIIIGMNNPISSAPGHELYPYPPGCTGHRLYQMLCERVSGVTRRQYLNAFERRNLVVGRAFDRTLARREAERIYAELWGSRRTVVLLGDEVRRSFGLEKVLLHPQLVGGVTWRQIPHPSGRNLWYNDQKNARMVGLLLEELYASQLVHVSLTTTY